MTTSSKKRKKEKKNLDLIGKHGEFKNNTATQFLGLQKNKKD